MKKVTFLFFLVIVFGCGNDSSAGEDMLQDDCIDEVVMPSKIEFGGDTVNITAVEPIKDAKTLEGIAKRTEASKVKDADCCISVDKMQVCCCEGILKKYKQLLQKDDFAAATELKIKDPFFSQCQKNYDDFDGKIESINTEVLGQ